MASPKTRRRLLELAQNDDNMKCFECNTLSPQWVSVSYGIWICLECSGKHRSLGVHLSFVRSVSMDKWKDIELGKMAVGGNRKARLFFESQPDWKSTLSFEQKYNSRAAALYRDKISTLAQGLEWDEKSSPAYNYNPISSNFNRPQLNFSNTNGYQNTDEYFDAEEYAKSVGSPGFKEQKTAFFMRKQKENAERPDDLPPSRGGRYSGFGNSPEPRQLPRSQTQELLDNTLSSVAIGWSIFSQAASKVATKASENAIKISEMATQKVKDGTLVEDIGSQVINLTSKIGELGRKGWQNIPSSNFTNLTHSQSENFTTSSSLTHDKIEQTDCQEFRKNDHAVESNKKLAPRTSESEDFIDWNQKLEDDAWKNLNE